MGGEVCLCVWGGWGGATLVVGNPISPGAI